MIPDFVDSSDGSHRFIQDYPRGPTDPSLEQVSLHYDGTITPSLFMGGSPERISQQGSFSISPYTAGDDHYRCPSTVPPTPAEIRTDYGDDHYQCSYVVSPIFTEVWEGYRDDHYQCPSTVPPIPAEIRTDYDGDDHYQYSSLVSPISTEIWVGYGDNDASVPRGVSSIEPTVNSWCATNVTFGGSCLCGCDRGACIPQRDYQRIRTDPLSEDELQEMILFSVNGVCGYPLADALKKRYTGLDKSGEKMFVSFKSSVSLRLEWLPYESWTGQIRTLNWKKNCKDHITRARVATKVAKRMNAFFQKMQGKDINPAYREYRVQPGVIDLDHLELVALRRVSKSSWMPEFRLIDRSHPPRYLPPIASSHTREHANPPTTGNQTFYL